MKQSNRPEVYSVSSGPFFGRLLISLIFILSGLSKIFSFSGIAEGLKGKGLEWAEILLIVAIIFELGGGLMVLLGWHTRIGIYLLMLFLLPTTFLFHNFWQLEGQEKMEQMAHFMKNLTIYGGLLLLWSYGPGRWSLDAIRWRKAK